MGCSTIRFSSTETQNVVTYPVVVAAPNPDVKLLPGMTAAISFRVDERHDVVKIPNAALRFYPDVKYVRKEDQKLLEGTDWDKSEADEDTGALSAEEKAEARKKQNRRHVWIVEGDKLRALEVTNGHSDSKITELDEGNLKYGTKLVNGIEPRQAFGG